MAREVMVNYENGKSPNTIYVGETTIDGEASYVIKWSPGPLKAGEFFKVLTPQQYEELLESDVKVIRKALGKVKFS